jgi:hypothetical protein
MEWAEGPSLLAFRAYPGFGSAAEESVNGKYYITSEDYRSIITEMRLTPEGRSRIE